MRDNGDYVKPHNRSHRIVAVNGLVRPNVEAAGIEPALPSHRSHAISAEFVADPSRVASSLLGAAPKTAVREGGGRYRTIVADPPWEIPFGSNRTPSANGGWAAAKWERAEVRDLPYPTMTTAAIAALPIGDMAAPDAHLYVWTVNRHVEATYGIVRAWGFRPAQLLTWCKAPMGLGLGGAFTPTTEHVLFCRRGTLSASQRVDSTWWQWKRGEHSAKPEAFLDLVEQVSPGPYCELFARRNRLGWSTWGDEALGHVQLGAAPKTAVREGRGAA